jgi:diguanylate cyclase (GGDEF)-like protein/PAS domain S-box-containing protein
MKSAPKALAAGVGLVVAGAVLVEALLLAGLQPLSPIGWPSVGMLAAAALSGLWGLAGGVAALLVYYAFNLAVPARFPEFFSSAFQTLNWSAGIALLSVAVLLVRRELYLRRKYEAASRESEQRLRVITDNVPGLVAYVDAGERYRFANRVYETWLGIPRAEIAGRSVRQVWGERLYRLIKPNIERALRGERVTDEYTLVHHGIERHVLASYVPDLDAEGKVQGYFLLGTDVSLLAAAQAELRAARERLEAALDGSSVALWDADLRSGRVYLSEAWARLIDAPEAETVVEVQSLIALMHPDDVEPAVRASIETMKGVRTVYAAEHRVRARSGEWRWLLSRGRVTERDPLTGRALRMIGTNVDITERKRQEEALQSAAHTDPLTGLANRMLLDDRLRLALARSRRSGTHIAVLFLDIDHFKEVNDGFGHALGDALLKEFAARLRACLRATDTVARLGGDEFVVLLEDLRDPAYAAVVAEKILGAMRAPVRLEGRELAVTTSIGVACADSGSDAEQLLRLADAALYEAKAAGRDTARTAFPGTRIAAARSTDRGANDAESEKQAVERDPAVDGGPRLREEGVPRLREDGP